MAPVFPARTALAAAAWCAPAPAPHVPRLATALNITRTVPNDGVWLTFDDGPHPHGTPAVLDALATAGAHATFFLVGEQVARRPALVQEIRAAGHHVGVHGHTHRLHLRLGPGALADDLDRAEEALGREARWHRAPYGVYSLLSLDAVKRRGWSPVLWSQWGRDWRADATADTIAQDLGAAGAGDVLLLHDSDAYSAHDSWRATAAALPRVLETLGERGIATVLPS